MATASGPVKIFSPWVCSCHRGFLRCVQAEEIVSPQGKHSSKEKYPY